MHRTIPNPRSKSGIFTVALALILVMTAVMATEANASGRFTDDNGNVHEGDIEAVAKAGIIKGCNPPSNNRYCPDRNLTRAELASLLDRALDWPNTSRDYFRDDNFSVHEDSINRMAAAGVTNGCDSGKFCPESTVTREQLAAFLARAFDLRNTSRDYFSDDNSSMFENDINRLARAGITKGCNPPSNTNFCPKNKLKRDQAASFIARALGLEPITPPPPTTPPPPPPGSGEIIWRGDVETGDTSQWRSVATSGRADVRVVTTPVHSGRYALRLANYDVDGSHNAGVRMNLQGPFGPDPKNLPDDGYYSAWYYIPFAFEGHSNIFQYKQSDATRWSGGEPTSHTRRMLWKLGLYWQGDGTYDLEVRTRINQDTGRWQSGSMRLGIIDANIPVGRWFHLETRYLWGQNGSGRTTVWLDGQKIWDRAASTEASNLECMHRCREWVVSHYLSDYQGYVAPGDSWIYLDDAMLATGRIGP